MSKTQDFLNEYMEEYISSIQGPGEAIKTQISSPASMSKVFNSVSEFKPRKRLMPLRISWPYKKIRRH